MNQDALVIARSILELKQDGDVLKDYIFPFFVAFFQLYLVPVWLILLIKGRSGTGLRGSGLIWQINYCLM